MIEEVVSSVFESMASKSLCHAMGALSRASRMEFLTCAGDWFRIPPSSLQRNAWEPGREIFWMTVLYETMRIYNTKGRKTVKCLM